MPADSAEKQPHWLITLILFIFTMGVFWVSMLGCGMMIFWVEGYSPDTLLEDILVQAGLGVYPLVMLSLLILVWRSYIQGNYIRATLWIILELLIASAGYVLIYR